MSEKWFVKWKDQEFDQKPAGSQFIRFGVEIGRIGVERYVLETMGIQRENIVELYPVYE